MKKAFEGAVGYIAGTVSAAIEQITDHLIDFPASSPSPRQEAPATVLPVTHLAPAPSLSGPDDLSPHAQSSAPAQSPAALPAQTLPPLPLTTVSASTDDHKSNRDSARSSASDDDIFDIDAAPLPKKRMDIPPLGEKFTKLVAREMADNPYYTEPTSPLASDTTEASAPYYHKVSSPVINLKRPPIDQDIIFSGSSMTEYAQAVAQNRILSKEFGRKTAEASARCAVDLRKGQSPERSDNLAAALLNNKEANFYESRAAMLTRQANRLFPENEWRQALAKQTKIVEEHAKKQKQAEMDRAALQARMEQKKQQTPAPKVTEVDTTTSSSASCSIYSDGISPPQTSGNAIPAPTPTPAVQPTKPSSFLDRVHAAQKKAAANAGNNTALPSPCGSHTSRVKHSQAALLTTPSQVQSYLRP